MNQRLVDHKRMNVGTHWNQPLRIKGWETLCFVSESVMGNALGDGKEMKWK